MAWVWTSNRPPFPPSDEGPVRDSRDGPPKGGPFPRSARGPMAAAGDCEAWIARDAADSVRGEPVEPPPPSTHLSMSPGPGRTSFRARVHRAVTHTAMPPRPSTGSGRTETGGPPHLVPCEGSPRVWPHRARPSRPSTGSGRTETGGLSHLVPCEGSPRVWPHTAMPSRPSTNRMGAGGAIDVACPRGSRATGPAVSRSAPGAKSLMGVPPPLDSIPSPRGEGHHAA